MPHTTWQTEEECPSCGAEMVLLDDGLPVLRAECHICGHAEQWETRRHNTDGGDNW